MRILFPLFRLRQQILHCGRPATHVEIPSGGSMASCTNNCIVLLRTSTLTYSIVRNLLRPRRNIPFRGIYKKEGDLVRKDDLLVYLKRDRAGQLLLKAMLDGRVMITQEKINPDFSIPEMLVYEDMDEIYKLTFNVLPLEMSQSFRNSPLVKLLFAS
uniref:Lipoyl-binding domain-containing protein n=1 Tax=Setaria digitata TaxID=48799 RepID=A0A915PSI6_9BILA